MRQENPDRAILPESWWDDWHTRRAAMGGYKLFRGFRQGRGSGGVALCDWEFGLSGSNWWQWQRWVFMVLSASANKAGILVGVCYTQAGERAWWNILLYYNVRIKSFSGRRRSLMITTIALTKTLNLPDAGNSTQRETVQEVPGVFNSQRRKERN